LSPRGHHGFGYDSIFELPDGRTLAEIELEEKNRISHRAQALQRARDFLEWLLAGQSCR
jgi:XTP/dITP diphosphohydrolase